LQSKNYQDIDWILDRKLNFEAGIGCRLRCGGCMMRFHMKPGSIRYKSYAWDRRYNIKFDKFKVVLDTFQSVQFCGNLSDPIYHPDFLKSLKYMKGKNIRVEFNTNGSGKTEKWWREVFELCKGEDWYWIFGLDGLPEESHLYRENQKGNQVWDIMKLGRDMDANISWQWIVFKYNQDHIEEGKLLAASEGISFLEMHSSRWVDDRWQGAKDMRVYKPDEEHRTSRRNEHIQVPKPNMPQNTVDQFEIDPDCLNNFTRKPMMFNSMGFFIPCCEKDQYVDALEVRGFYQDKFHIDNLHTVDDVKNVFLSDTWQNFYKGLHDDPINASPGCQEFCGKSEFHKDGFGADPKGFV
jgi:hypothetical protein